MTSNGVIDRVKHVTDQASGEAMALVPLDSANDFSMEQYLGTVTSESALNQQKALATAYDRAVESLIGENDVQKEGQRSFKKKSAWRKLQRHFRIDTRIIAREFVDVHASGSLHDADRIVTTAVVTVEARAPWGQVAQAIGACGFDEETAAGPQLDANGAQLFWPSGDPKINKGKAISLADMVATAETRATNRAVSNLIAMGEVSAEEIGRRNRDGGSGGAPSRGNGGGAQRSNGGGNGGGSAEPSAKQMEYFDKLTKDRALTNDERAIAAQTFEKAVAEKWDRQRVSKVIDKLKQKVEEAKAVASNGGNPTPTDAALGSLHGGNMDEPDFALAPNDDDDGLPF